MLTLLFQYLELRFKSKAAKLTGTTMMILQQVSLCNRPQYMYDDSIIGKSLLLTTIPVSLECTYPKHKPSINTGVCSQTRHYKSKFIAIVNM